MMGRDPCQDALTLSLSGTPPPLPLLAREAALPVPPAGSTGEPLDEASSLLP